MDDYTVTAPDPASVTDPAAALVALDGQLRPLLELRSRLQVLASAVVDMARIREAVATAVGQPPPPAEPLPEPEPPEPPEPEPVPELMPPPPPEVGQA